MLFYCLPEIVILYSSSLPPEKNWLKYFSYSFLDFSFFRCHSSSDVCSISIWDWLDEFELKYWTWLLSIKLNKYYVWCSVYIGKPIKSLPKIHWGMTWGEKKAFATVHPFCFQDKRKPKIFFQIRKCLRLVT